MLFDEMDEPAIDLDVIEDLVRWGSGTLTHRCGRFLDAVLRNDLANVVSVADDEDLLTLPAIMSFIRRELPPESWGSGEAVHAWLASARAEAVSSAP